MHHAGLSCTMYNAGSVLLRRILKEVWGVLFSLLCVCVRVHARMHACMHACMRVCMRALPLIPKKSIISRVPDQNGISQTCYIVEIYHFGPELSICMHVLANR